MLFFIAGLVVGAFAMLLMMSLAVTAKREDQMLEDQPPFNVNDYKQS